MSDLITERGEHYGDPRENHHRIAGMWSALLGVTITAHDVALMMILLKVSRAKNDPFLEDNIDDGQAYWEIARRVR